MVLETPSFWLISRFVNFHSYRSLILYLFMEVGHQDIIITVAQEKCANYNSFIGESKNKILASFLIDKVLPKYTRMITED